MNYRAPIDETYFMLRHVVGLDRAIETVSGSASDAELIGDLLSELGRFVESRIAPTNALEDPGGAWLRDGAISVPPELKQAHDELVDSGWYTISHPEQWGGGGQPSALGLVVQDFVAGANMGYGLLWMLNEAVVDMFVAHGTPGQQQAYLPALVSGQWAGTMSLTEPDAGSDLGAVRTRAQSQDDGSYLLTGSKHFITWGDHDLTDNIAHMVLARTPGAPDGTRGLSCFVVPKYLIGPDGRPGEANDVSVPSVERKLGIHSSPTCVLDLGRGGGARGWLVGGENRGMAGMFTMMNRARLCAGVQGLAQAQQAYWLAADYARLRRQGRAVGQPRGAKRSLIGEHPDVRRMLVRMRALCAAMRFLIYETAVVTDLACDPAADRHRRRLAVLTPVAKAWCADRGNEVAYLAMQVHGGVGYIEETGVAQLARDVRITPLYEGTNGIQAQDLVMRKLPADDGLAMSELFADIDQAIHTAASVSPQLGLLAAQLGDALGLVRQLTGVIGGFVGDDPRAAEAASVAYQDCLGLLLGGWGLLRSATAATRLGAEASAARHDPAAKVAEAGYFIGHLLPEIHGRAASIRLGIDYLDDIPLDRL